MAGGQARTANHGALEGREAQARQPACEPAVICHTVGTPAGKGDFLGLDAVRKSTCRPCAGPGNTNLAPVMAAEYGRPQAFTWNMGTTGSIAVARVMLSASGRAPARACSIVERWL